MLPLFKVISLAVRVFSRPMFNHLKKYHLGKHKKTTDWLGAIFIRMGLFYNRMETKINKKFLKIDTKGEDIFIKPLSDDVALEKGVEFFYEILVYSILLGLPIYEMWHAQVSAGKKSKALDNRIDTIETQIKELTQKRDEEKQELASRFDKIENLINSKQSNSPEVLQQIQMLKGEIQSYIDMKTAISAVTPTLDVKMLAQNIQLAHKKEQEQGQEQIKIEKQAN